MEAPSVVLLLLLSPERGAHPGSLRCISTEPFLTRDKRQQRHCRSDHRHVRSSSIPVALLSVSLAFLRVPLAFH